MNSGSCSQISSSCNCPIDCSLITALFLHSPDKQLSDEPVRTIRKITQIAEGDEEESCPIEPYPRS